MRIRRRRSSVLPRAPWPNGLERTEPLKGQLWTRSEKSTRPPDVHWAARLLATCAAVLEISILAWLWFGPAFGLRTVEVYGARHLTAQQVAAAAGISGGSVVSVDGTSAQERLLDQVWIRAATVQPELPGTVVIKVSEWEPVAAYHAGASPRLFLLSSQAVVLGSTPASGGLVDIQGPAGSDPRIGDRPLDAQLLTALVNIQRSLPTLLGQDVAGFIFDSCGDLTMIAKKGWRVYFGRVLTLEEFSSLRDKLSALKAIAGKNMVDYSSTDLLYVNVMNPSEPAVGYRSRQPAAPSPSPGATPAPSSPSPTSPCR
jgi:cell division protein FtsQ